VVPGPRLSESQHLPYSDLLGVRWAPPGLGVSQVRRSPKTCSPDADATACEARMTCALPPSGYSRTGDGGSPRRKR
jgi:hypothetical protein